MVPLVQENPLNSCDALKMRKELSQTSDEVSEIPVVKSLFDVKGNSKYKKDSNLGYKKAADKSLTESSDSDEGKEEDVKEMEPPKIVFKSLTDNKIGSKKQ